MDGDIAASADHSNIQSEDPPVVPKTKADVALAFKNAIAQARVEGIQNRVLQSRLKLELSVVNEIHPRLWFIRYLPTPSFVTFIVLPILCFLAIPSTLAYFAASTIREGGHCISWWIPFDGLISLPVTNCSFCAGITEAPRLKNLSMDDFVRKYAYTGVPIVVTDATDGWKARKLFTYNYFKSLYADNPKSLVEDTKEGQFFMYRSDLEDLYDLFTLPDERAAMRGKKWYIGWSSGDPKIGGELTKHYSQPYFIPPQPESEETRISWIFMGSPGPGAFMHLDLVALPSWQAQLRGKKTWTVAPQPECEHICHTFNVTVNTGDLFVLNTNIWYHSTYIHPGSISITIGTEFE